MRGAVSIEGVRKTYGDVVALREVSLEVRPGEFLTLLGPSGCGKTTLLRLLAGFEKPDAGRIVISGRDVATLPPYERPVNTVFQHYALFPHRTVAGNVAFGLEGASAHEGARSASAWTRPSRWCACRATATGASTSSRAGRSSGWPSPGRWCWSPRCCSSTSPWRPST